MLGCVLLLTGCMLGAAEAPIRAVPFTDVRMGDGFWRARMEVNRTVTIPYDFKKCEETGRISNFAKAGGLMTGDFEGIYFNDSDVYKVIEGAAYSLQQHPDAELEKYVDGVIDKIAAAQWEDGYLYTFYSVPKRQPEKRWTNERDMHETYCAGHFFEAAVAYYQATGKKKILDVAVRLADHIDSVFGPGRKYDTPGHEEIEIGLVKLSQVTGQEKYLKLAEFFIDQRGNKENRPQLYGEYCQDHKPVTAQSEATGHSVRAGYLYTGMADVAALRGRNDYLAALDRIWQDVAGQKMYLTGGIGSRAGGEAFGEDYELPNKSAYNETCAAIANALWNHRMFLVHGDAKYVDVLERVIYNGFLSGISLTGDRFFYPNPLASDVGYERSPWFDCSCCPVNVVRFIPSIAGYVYAVKGDSLYVNLYAAGSATVDLGGQKVGVTQDTRYPWDGRVVIGLEPEKAGRFTLALRIPGWARNEPVPSDLYRYVGSAGPQVKLAVNGSPVELTLAKGYAAVERDWKAGDRVMLEMPMPIRRVVAHENVQEDRGKVALERGPIVYCLEGVDNPGPEFDALVLGDGAQLKSEYRADLLGGVEVISGEAQTLGRMSGGAVESKARSFTAIPYYAWAHRGPSPMTVWLARTAEAAFVAPPPTIASASKVSTSFQTGTANARLRGINDQREPKKSSDSETAFFHWWPHKGTTEWVQYDLAGPQRVSRCDVYWFDDTGHGECRTPKGWRVLYRQDGGWKPVTGVKAYSVTKDAFDLAEFDDVETDALRLEVEFQKDFSSGIQEWKVR